MEQYLKKQYRGRKKQSEKKVCLPALIQSKVARGAARDFYLMGTRTAAGTKQKFVCNFSAIPEKSTVVIVNGQLPGPVLCLTAAIHGNELNGVEIVRQLLAGLDPLTLRGIVIGVPIVNLEGYNLGGRYMGDHCDLNRCFPGAPDGSEAERFAHKLFQEIILCSDVLIDLHTGSALRENHPQLRADLSNSRVAALSHGFGTFPVVQSIAPSGSLRGAATLAGVPCLVMEVGSSRGLEPDKILIGLQGLKDLMQAAGMTKADHFVSDVYQVYLGSGWVHAAVNGILTNRVELGQIVKSGEHLAEILDPLTNQIHMVAAPFACVILSRAHNQHVAVGFRLFRIGIRSIS